jgi:hypothetical protein
MGDCANIVGDFYDGLGFIGDEDLLNAERASIWVNVNIMKEGQVTEDGQNLLPLIGGGDAQPNILRHEECYLRGNLTTSTESSELYRQGNFYKTSSMTEDLHNFTTTGDTEQNNVCGQGQYIYTDVNPSTGEIIEECQPCGTPPPGKENLDYNINTNVVTLPTLTGMMELKINELQEEGDQNAQMTNLGTIQERGAKDFEQDYTMYRYGIANQEQLTQATERGVLQEGNEITERAKTIYEEHGYDGVPNNKLDRESFLDVQKQCSPLISDWFPSQHGRNRSRRRRDLLDFDTKSIQYADTSTRRATDLLQGNPMNIMDFFNREYNSLLKDTLRDHVITREMLTPGGNKSIINNIRILDVDSPPISDLQRDSPLFTEKLISCSDPSNSKCETIGGQAYYMSIPVELARVWIANKFDSIERNLPTQEGNLATLYGDLSSMFSTVDPQIEECINDIIGNDDRAEDIMINIEATRGDFTKFGDREIQYLRRKIVMFIHSPDERIRECIDMMYMNSTQNLCTEGLYNKTLKILTILFSLLSVNIDLSDIETNHVKYNSVMNFIDSLGDLFPRAIEKIIGIVQDLEKDLCNTSIKSDIIANLYDDLVNKNRKYNIEMGMFGQLFSLDDNQFSRIVDTYNMVSPVLGRLFGPTVQG